MSLSITGTRLLEGRAEIYSVTQRPVLNVPPPTNEIVITMLANSSQSQSVAQELWSQLELLQNKFGCHFTDLVRFGKLRTMHVAMSLNTHFLL